MAAVKGVVLPFVEFLTDAATAGAGAGTVTDDCARAISSGGEAFRLAYNTAAAATAAIPANMRRRARVIARSVAHDATIA